MHSFLGTQLRYTKEPKLLWSSVPPPPSPSPFDRIKDSSTPHFIKKIIFLRKWHRIIKIFETRFQKIFNNFVYAFGGGVFTFASPEWNQAVKKLGKFLLLSYSVFWLLQTFFLSPYCAWELRSKSHFGTWQRALW